MLDSILEDCRKQLRAALKYKEHAFRFFTLATQKENGSSQLRTVVLRDFHPRLMQFTIFTDSRSQKVIQLTNNEHAQFLFYDAARMIQLIIEAKIIEISRDTSIYDSLPEPNKKDYSGIQIPGTPIDSPDKITHDFSKAHLTKLTFQAHKLEYLRLKRPNHIRAAFNLSNQWKGQFLAP